MLIGFLLLSVFWLIGFVAIRSWNRKSLKTSSLFLLSNRSVGLLLGTVSVATAWIWAPALFVASQKAYEQGLPGLFWFTFPNAMALVLFSFLAVRMKKIFNHGYTLPEYMKIRFDKKVQVTYMIAIFIVQIYSVILQTTAALLMLNLITGIDKSILVLILGFIILSLSLIAGFRSSLTADAIKAFFIGAVAVFIIPWVIGQSGGLINIARGLGGVSGKFTDIFNLNVAMTFGVPISVSLFSGIVIDQQQWQRAFAMKSNITRKAFLFGAILFAIVPILLGTLGFAAAGSGIHISPIQTQLSGLYLIKNFLPKIGIYIFTFMILAGLVAAGMAALSAASSVGAVDLFRLFKKHTSDKEIILVSRITMFVILLIGVIVALIPNVQIVYIVLLIGAFRASLMIPTILSLYVKRLSTNFTFMGTVLGMLVGVPLFIYGSIQNIPAISSFGSLAPILVSTAFCLLGLIFDPKKFDYAKFSKTAVSLEKAQL